MGWPEDAALGVEVKLEKQLERPNVSKVENVNMQIVNNYIEIVDTKKLKQRHDSSNKTASYIVVETKEGQICLTAIERPYKDPLVTIAIISEGEIKNIQIDVARPAFATLTSFLVQTYNKRELWKESWYEVSYLKKVWLVILALIIGIICGSVIFWGISYHISKQDDKEIGGPPSPIIHRVNELPRNKFKLIKE